MIEQILEMAERDCQAVSMAKERAAYGEWPPPQTPGDLLAWIEDEAEIQLQQGIDNPGERQRLPYARRLRHWAAMLKGAGVSPAKLPWR